MCDELGNVPLIYYKKYDDGNMTLFCNYWGYSNGSLIKKRGLCKSGLKNMKRGMNDYNKQNKKMYKKMRLNKELIKNFNKQCDADSKSRSKALKDTKLRDADLYK